MRGITYGALAEVLAELASPSNGEEEEAMRVKVAVRLADLLAFENPSFSRPRFLNACKVKT